MTQPQILEGKWEEILAHNSAQLMGRRVRVYVESTEDELGAPAHVPNDQALAMIRDLLKLQEGMKETDGSETERWIREARSGGMYGLKPSG